jgi:hypothetical protein
MLAWMLSVAKVLLFNQVPLTVLFEGLASWLLGPRPALSFCSIAGSTSKARWPVKNALIELISSLAIAPRLQLVENEVRKVGIKAF